MKKKILSLALAFALVLGVTATAAGCKSQLEELYKYENKTNSAYSSATKIEAVDGYTKGDSSNYGLVCFYKTDAGVKTFQVFNFNTGKIVLTTTLNEDAGDEGEIYIIGLDAVKQAVIITTSKAADATDTTCKLYDANGTEIAALTQKNELVFGQKLDFVKIEGLCFRVNSDGSVVKAFEFTDLNGFDINTLLYKAAGYYYGYNGTNHIISVYDLSGNLVSYYKLPEYADDVDWYVLNDGNIFVQSITEEEAQSTVYDYIRAGKKYTFEQKIVNPKNGEEDDVKNEKNPVLVDSVVGVGVLPAAFENYEGSVKNFAHGVKITNKRLDEAADYEMSNGGKLEEIENIIPAQQSVFDGGVVFKNGNYIVTNKLGQKFLYNADGKLVGEISGMIETTGKFIRTGKAIYDYNLNKIVDLVNNAADGYKYVSSVGDNIRLTTKNTDGVDEHYILKDGNGPVFLAKDSDLLSFMSSGKYMQKKSLDNKYTIYNEDGAALTGLTDLDVEPSLVVKNSDNSKIVFKVGDSFFYVA